MFITINTQLGIFDIDIDSLRLLFLSSYSAFDDVIKLLNGFPLCCDEITVSILHTNLKLLTLESGQVVNFLNFVLLLSGG